jgi:DNA polymerase III sliding clamp (beta) subunit (PCNA family)
MAKEGKFSCPKSVIKDLLDMAAPLTSSSNSMPIFQCFLIKVSPKSLTVSSADLDHAIVVSSDELDTLETFSFIVSAARFHSVVRQADTGPVEFILKGNMLTVYSGRVSWEIKLPIGEFFPLSDLTADEIEVSAEELTEAIRAVKKSVSLEETRSTLRMIDVSKGKMTSCDGVRLSQVLLSEDFPVDFSMHIPLKAIDLVLHIIKDPLSSVFLSETDKKLVFKSNNTVLVVNKLNAKFPNVEQLMLRPALENKAKFLVDRSELLKAITRVKINADADTDAVGLFISSMSLTVSSRDTNGNGSSEVVPANWSGKDRMLVVSHKYLTQLIQSSKSDTCELFLGEDTKSRKSVILMKEERLLGVIPQLSGNFRMF